MTETDDTLVVGVDIGGTKVAAGLVDRNGEIKTQVRTPMVANREPGDGLAAVVSAIDLLFAHDANSTNSDSRNWHLRARAPGSKYGSGHQSSQCSVLAQFSPGSRGRENLSGAGEGRERCQRGSAG